MEFYTSIAGVYDRIFPFDEDLPPFIMGLNEGRAGRILDIGCATGHLANALAGLGNEVVGIDLDPEMVRIARGRFQNTQCSFRVADMTRLEGQFEPASFDCVCCFGNTLVHLPDRPTILSMLRQVRGLLRPGGLIVGQIIHYDRILAGRLGGLATIERPGLRFERRYLYKDGDPRIEFRTTLQVDERPEPIVNSIPLYPVTAAELAEAIRDAGFEPGEFCADTDRTLLDRSSIALYFVARVAPVTALESVG